MTTTAAPAQPCGHEWKYRYTRGNADGSWRTYCSVCNRSYGCGKPREAAAQVEPVDVVVNADVVVNVPSELERFRRGEPGIYIGIAAEEYHRLRAISSSILKRVQMQSPDHARAALNNPDLIKSDEIQIGAAAHALVLTPEDFEATYVCAGQCEAIVKSSGQPCENSGVKYFDGQWLCGVHGKGAAHELGGEVLKTDVYRRVRGIHDKLWADETARNLLTAASDHELSVLWLDDSTGLLCKARFDFLCRDIGILPDLKTCRCSKPAFFIKDAWERGYHIQLAHYARGAIVAGIAADLPTIIAVENEEPFTPVVFEPTRRFMDEGRKAAAEAMETLQRCEQSGVWPGYCRGVQQLDVPKWVA